MQEHTGIPAVGCLSTPVAFPTPVTLSLVARGSFLGFAMVKMGYITLMKALLPIWVKIHLFTPDNKSEIKF